MAYSVDAIPDNCYEGTTCLINKLDIRDEDKLNFVESQITIHKTAELASVKNFGEFDFSHYKAIHKYLFNELYAWAGEIRTVNMSKKGTNFVNVNEIESVAGACVVIPAVVPVAKQMIQTFSVLAQPKISISYLTVFYSLINNAALQVVYN